MSKLIKTRSPFISFIDRYLGYNQLENLPKDIFMNNTNLRGL